MSANNRLSLAGMLAALALAIGNFGCGGGQASPPPPPPIAVSVSPTADTVAAGSAQIITASVNNDPNNRGVTWTISPASGVGTLSNSASTSVVYSAPANWPASGLTATITATSVADPTKSAAATITVPPKPTGITVSISPATAMVAPGGHLDFGATVSNDPTGSGVTWSLSPAAGGGTLSGFGAADAPGASYTAPATLLSANLNVTVTAISVADPTKSASAVVTVTTEIFVAVSSTARLIQVTGTVPLSANVTNDSKSAGVTWSLAGCMGDATVCGSFTNISNSGSLTADYVAPPTVPPGGQVSVVATSVTDPTKSASCQVAISPINFTSQNYPAGNSPEAVVVADFNGDGKLDIAVADHGDPSTGDTGGVSILLGNGDGTFQPATLITAGKNPDSIAVGDFNNDGKQDMVVTDFGDRSSNGNGNLSILLGNGDGTFQSPVALTAGPEPIVLATGDFNNDGKLDFAVTDNSAGVYIFLGNGDGTFSPPKLMTTGNAPSAMVAHDFNGDGKLDLAVGGLTGTGSASECTDSILLGNGDGTFAAQVANDLNSCEVSVLTSMAVGDLNGDGKPDLATTKTGGAFGVIGGVLLTQNGNGDGTFQPAQALQLSIPSFVPCSRQYCPPWSVYIADFSGNGRSDLVDITGRFVTLYPANGDGTYEGVLVFEADQGPFALAIGDFNGDGKPDIVVANSQSNDVTVLLNASVP